MKKLMEGQKPAVKAEPMPRAIEDCFADIKKGSAAIYRLHEALADHVRTQPVGKSSRLYTAIGKVDDTVFGNWEYVLDGIAHYVWVTQNRLRELREKRTPSSPADRADKRIMDWCENFGPAADAAIEMLEEVDAAKHGERSTRLEVLTPEGLAALSDETLDIAADNLKDLVTKVNEAQHVIKDLQQERAEAAQQVAEAAGG